MCKLEEITAAEEQRIEKAEKDLRRRCCMILVINSVIESKSCLFHVPAYVRSILSSE